MIRPARYPDPMTLPFADETARCRVAQADWFHRPVRDRLRLVRELRHLLVEEADTLTAAVEADVGRPPGEVVATDLLPTAAACKYLLTDAERILRPKKVGRRPLWLYDCRDVVHRRPHGVAGVIGTWNYPVFLNAVPVLHALVAGNGVLWKPSELAPRTADVLHGLFRRAGVPDGLLRLLPATRDAGPQLADADIDFLHFTGSDAVGAKLAARLGERLVPSVLELSGVDAVFVLPDADVRLAARAAWYGATLNAGQTCMASRRAFVHRDVVERFAAELRPLVEMAAPVRLVMPGQAEQARRLQKDAEGRGLQAARGLAAGGAGTTPAVVFDATPDLALCREAAFAPLLAVLTFADTDQAVAMDRACPFGLTAAVFTADPRAAGGLAARLRVGAVVVNDVIVPTAHPATPFGGRGRSGWGVTQGEEGLLAMTAPQVVTRRLGTFRPHIDSHLAGDTSGDVARGVLRMSHGRGLAERWRGLRQMLGGMRRAKRGG
jgi:acyl-CoA reductase-like NAD-dependent aldehyde dehydrogenase